MSKLLFIADHHYETHGPKKGPKFSKDETILASPDFADRCVGLGVAEVVGQGLPKEGDGKFTRLKGAKPGSDYTPEKEKGPAAEAAGAAEEPAAAAAEA